MVARPMGLEKALSHRVVLDELLEQEVEFLGLVDDDDLGRVRRKAHWRGGGGIEDFLDDASLHRLVLEDPNTPLEASGNRRTPHNRRVVWPSLSILIGSCGMVSDSVGHTATH